MDMETLAIAQQKTDDRSIRNEGRIKKLEEEHEVLHKLATSVAVMAEKMDTMNKSMDSLTAKVDEIESKPAKQWDKVVTAIIGALVGAFVSWVASGSPGL
jgi:uncharacterized coiled-coil protein SlyX